MLTMTKRFRFCGAHMLEGHEGKCGNLHGHNFVLEVTLKNLGIFPKNTIIPYSHMIIDFSDLKSQVKMHVIDKLDHTNLNDLMPVPTAEAIAIWIFDTLGVTFGSGLEKVRIYESEDSWVEVTN